jgi:hypothetical protein
MFPVKRTQRRDRRHQAAVIELSYRAYHQTPPHIPSRPIKPRKPKGEPKVKPKPKSAPAPKVPFDPTDPRQLPLFPEVSGVREP